MPKKNQRLKLRHFHGLEKKSWIYGTRENNENKTVAKIATYTLLNHFAGVFFW